MVVCVAVLGVFCLYFGHDFSFNLSVVFCHCFFSVASLTSSGKEFVLGASAMESPCVGLS